MPDFPIGGIVWANLDPAKGYEQSGKRPVVIPSHFKQLGLVIVLPLTTRDKGWSTVVTIPKEESKLPETSYALCHQIRSLSAERVEGLIGRISPLTLGKIRTVLGHILQL